MKTAMEELIKWMDDNKSHCTYGTIRGKATELLSKEKKQIIKAVNDSCTINSKKGFIPYGKDYYNQTYNNATKEDTTLSATDNLHPQY